MQIPKAAAPALKAYSEPEPEPEKEEVLENVTTEFLNPKAGTYGDIDGTWTFTLAGSRKSPIHARITDENFLASFGRGAIRFYHDDLLKVRLRTRQQMRGGRGKITRDIIEVLEYKKARIQRPRQS